MIENQNTQSAEDSAASATVFAKTATFDASEFLHSILFKKTLTEADLHKIQVAIAILDRSEFSMFARMRR